MRIPEKFTQGDFVSWLDIPTTDNLGVAIDSSSYDLKYAIRGATSLDLTATAEGTSWRLEISATDSTGLQSGTYFWQAFVVSKTDTAKKLTIGNGRVEILKGLSSVTGVYDGRTQARKDLEAVEAAIRALVSGGAVQEYTIGHRSFRKMSIEDLRILQSQLKFDVAKEERGERMKAGLGDPFNMYVRFK